MHNDRVTTEYTGGGDPKRSIDLLWGRQEPPQRGPKPRLTAREITRAAIDIADTHGLHTLSMRRVAETLGVATMSLYTYVPSKAELLDVMLDTVLGEAARPPHAPGHWRDSLEHIARENLALYRRHPWMLQVATTRPPLGPGLTAKYEYELTALDGIGLTDIEMDSVLTLVLAHVRGAALGMVEFSEVVRRSGETDAQWWYARAPLLAEVMDDDDYPVSSRVGTSAAQAYNAASSPEHAFEFGLHRVLDGIDVLIRSRTTPST